MHYKVNIFKDYWSSDSLKIQISYKVGNIWYLTVVWVNTQKNEMQGLKHIFVLIFLQHYSQ